MTKFDSLCKSLLLVGAMLCVGGTYAAHSSTELEALVLDQTKLITGKVLDQAGNPVVGASLIIMGTTNGAISNADGSYSLQASPSNVLEVSFIGYKTQEIPVGQQSSINVTLLDDALTVDEVVVTSLGIKRDTKALGYAIQEVGGESLLNSRTTNVTNALTGKVAGLQVIRGSGATGSSKIVLRGQTSLTGNNQPLIVVDGVPMDNFVGGSADVWGTGSMDMGNGMSDLNPEDVESMTVLKGGSAAALYGSRAGNGVILVTTKSGKVNNGLGITVSGSIGIENILVSPDLQSDFTQGSLGGLDLLSRNSWGPKADGRQYNNWNGDPENLQIYDNIGNFFRTGVIDTETITFQQQVNKTSVYSSVTRMHDKSMVPGTSLDRVSITARATTNLGASDKWKLDVKANYVNSQAQNRPIQGINQSNTFHTLNMFPRSLDIRQFNPSTDAKGDQIWWDPQNTPQDNPWWTTQHDLNNDERNRLLGFMSLSYKFTEWLSLEGKGGLDYYSTRTYGRKSSGGLSAPKGRYTEGMNDFMEQNYSALLIARKDNLFGKWGGFFTLGGNMMLQDNTNMSAASGDLLIPNVFSLNNGVDKPTVSSGMSSRRINSIYGSLQVNWDQSIFVDATVRNDWSSTMSKENRSYLYPSVSVSGVLSQFINLPDWFSFAKIRGSFAEVGNDLSPYQLYNSYSVSKSWYENYIANRTTTLYNPDVRSELIKTWEVGADVRFLQNRLRADFSWYRSNATRQLLKIPLDRATGYENMMINAGNIQNEGIELTIFANIFDTKGGFVWDASLNFSKNKNKIIELADGLKEYPLGSMETLRVVAPVGGLYGEIYGSTIKRISLEDAEAAGQPELAGQTLLNNNGYPQEGNVEYLGNQQPKFLIGFNNSFSYKNVTLDFLIDARIGGKMYSMTSMYMHKTGNGAATVGDGDRSDFVTEGYVLNSETKKYEQNTTPVRVQDYWQSYVAMSNTGIHEAFTYDATSVRLRTLSLGYELPRKVLQNTPIQRLKFSVTANNLWLMYTALPGIDPESVSNLGTNNSALELGVPPTTRTFTFNVTIGF